MLYQFYQTMTDMSEPFRMFASAGLSARPLFGQLGKQPLANSMFAAVR